MPCPERDQTIYIQEKEVKTVKTFKYLGSMFDANGGAVKDVNNRVKIAWSKWRETTGVMCDRNIPTKLNDKVYKTAIKPAMVYGAECWAVRKKEERKLHTTEMRMLRWARGKTRLRPCEKCRHLERGTHVPDGGIPKREEVEMVRPCTKER